MSDFLKNKSLNNNQKQIGLIQIWNLLNNFDKQTKLRQLFCSFLESLKSTILNIHKYLPILISLSFLSLFIIFSFFSLNTVKTLDSLKTDTDAILLIDSSSEVKVNDIIEQLNQISGIENIEYKSWDQVVSYLESELGSFNNNTLDPILEVVEIKYVNNINSDKVSKVIKNSIINETNIYKSWFLSDSKTNFKEGVNKLKIALSIIFLLVLVTCFILIYNVVYLMQISKERTYKILFLNGVRDFKVFFPILIEVLFLSLISFILSIFLFKLLFNLFSANLSSISFFNESIISFNSFSLIFCLVVLMLVSFLASLAALIRIKNK